MEGSQSTLTYIVKQIRHACCNYKERKAGSAGERACQTHFARELGQWSDMVGIEDFTLHPDAFLGWVRPACILGGISCLLIWFQLFGGGRRLALAALLCAGAAALLCLGQFILYRKWFDFLYPKSSSLNVFARRKPKGQIRARIIFGGHADAAYEMPFLLHPNKRLIYGVIGGAIGGLACLLCIALGFFIRTGYGPVSAQGVWLALGILALMAMPALCAALFFIDRKRVVDGANDNLSGCLVAMGVLREMARQGVRLEHTEVCCLITGGEESGLRGAMAFAKAHKTEMQQVDTIFIALETLREPQQLMVYTRGINGTQANSPRAAALLRRAARSQGIALEEAGVYPGATDAEAFSREGLAACALCGVDHDPKPYYHTRLDSYENIDASCLRLSLNICLQAAAILDADIAEGQVLAIPAQCLS